MNEALLDEFRPWLISVTNHEPDGSVPLMPSASPQTHKKKTLLDTSKNLLNSCIIEWITLHDVN